MYRHKTVMKARSDFRDVPRLALNLRLHVLEQHGECGADLPGCNANRLYVLTANLACPSPGISKHPSVKQEKEIDGQNLFVLCTEDPFFASRNVLKLPLVECPLSFYVVRKEPRRIVGIERRSTGRKVKL